MRLREQLRYYLNELEISASRLSKKSGVPNTTLAEWLHGRQPRNIAHLKKLADYLGTTIDNLLYGHGADSQELSEKVASRAIEMLMGEQWIGGCFEVKMRRVTKE